MRASLRRGIRSTLAALNLRVARRRPFLRRLYPYRPNRYVAPLLGPDLARPVSWTASEFHDSMVVIRRARGTREVPSAVRR